MDKQKLKKKQQRQKKRKLAAEARKDNVSDEEDQKTNEDVDQFVQSVEPKETNNTSKRVIGVWPNEWPNQAQVVAEEIGSIPNMNSTSASLHYFAQTQEPRTNPSATNKEQKIQEAEIEKDPRTLLYEESRKRFKKMGETENTEPTEPKKQHSGLRCKKCFVLLAKDADFELRNGRLWINPRLLKDKEWDGFVFQGSRVFCQNMHTIGYKESNSWTNKTIYDVYLKTDKTTFEENFAKNPKFAGSDIIKNKLKFATIEPKNDPSDPWHKVRMLDAELEKR